MVLSEPALVRQVHQDSFKDLLSSSFSLIFYEIHENFSQFQNLNKFFPSLSTNKKSPSNQLFPKNKSNKRLPVTVDLPRIYDIWFLSVLTKAVVRI